MIPRVPVWLRALYGPVRWHFPEYPENIYITFDDGPHPCSTPSLVELLDKLDVKATFFCLGEHLEAYPNEASLIKEKGHLIANHGYRHLNGWRCSWPVFRDNVVRGSVVSGSGWFRPPYGRLFPNYAKRLLKDGITTLLWDVLSGDYRFVSSPEHFAMRCLKYTQGGSVLVFHDKPEVLPLHQRALPLLVNNLRMKGFSFSVIPPVPSSPAQ